MRWISFDIARVRARHLTGLLTATVAFAVLGPATPAHAATTYLITSFAQATAPKGVAVDPAGNVYIADAADNDVVEVTPAGAATVVASGLNAPSGVAVDPANGDVYVADTGNHEVDRLGPSGTLSVVAGTGTAGSPTAGPATASALGGPSGLAVDGAGNLYIADGAGTSGNPLVEKVAPDGTLSVFAGTGTSGTPTAGTATQSPLRTPTGVAVDAGGNAFIADAGASLVLKVTPAGALTIIAGRPGLTGQPTQGTATHSRLNGPTGVAASAAGIVYIADTANNRVEEVTPAGWLYLFAGTGTSGAATYGISAAQSRLSGPGALAVGGDGRIYVANATASTVDRIAPAPPALGAAPTPSGTTTQGHTLTATPGAWANAPTSFTYAWERCNAGASSCAVIASASGPTYTLTAADAGATIRSLVTAANVTGATTVASSATAIILPQPPASTGAPAIAGAATNLQTLAASVGTWTNTPTKFSYKWEDCDASGAGCTAISGATAPTYTLAYSDVGNTIRIVVTAANAGGSATATSDATAAIAPALVPWANTPVPTLLAAPSVTGSTVVGSTLTCASGNWAGSPTGYEYRWNRGDAPILNATAATYTVTTADRGHAISCTVTAINAGGAIQADSARLGIPAAGKARAKANRKPRRALTKRKRHRHAKAAKRRRPTGQRRSGKAKRR